MTVTDAYTFNRAYYEVPRTVACPRCKQPRGHYCRSTGDYTVGFHQGRIRAVAHLSAQERSDAMQALQAEEAAVRKQVEEVLAKPLTAEEQATRTAINAAFQAADVRFRDQERAMYARCRDPWIHPEACRCREGVPYVHPAPKPRVVHDVTDLSVARARKAAVR